MTIAELLDVMLLALLPGAGNLIGSALGELTRPPRRLVGVALHAAAGVAIAVVSMELVPRAVEDGSPPVLALAFLGGAALSVGLARGVDALRTLSTAGSPTPGESSAPSAQGSSRTATGA